MRLLRHEFEAWLRAKQPREIVGENRDCNACPIALFYKDTAGSEIIIAGDGENYFIDRGYDKRLAPRWVAGFIADVDADGPSDVSAAHALAILTGTYP